MEISELILRRIDLLQYKSLEPITEVVVSKTEWDALETNLKENRVTTCGVELPATGVTWDAFKAAVDLKYKNLDAPLKMIEFMGPYGPAMVKRAIVD